MKLLLRCYLSAITCSSLILTGTLDVRASDLNNRSTSSSGQFTIYAGEPVLRMSASSAAERVKEKNHSLLGIKSAGDPVPIIITLRPRRIGDTDSLPARVGLTRTLAGPKVDVLIRTGPSLVPVDFHLLITHAVLLDIALDELGEEVASGAARLQRQLPEWMVLGVATLSDPQQFPRAAYVGLVETGNIPDLDRFILNPPAADDITLDAKVYRIYAASLVATILDLKDGKSLFRMLLKNALLPQTLATLESLAPVLESAGSLSGFKRQWSLQLAKLAEPDGSQLAATEDSVRRLQAEFNRQFTIDQSSPPATATLAEITSIPDTPEVEGQMRAAAQELTVLAAMANPLTAPIYNELATVCQRKAEGKNKKLEQQVAALQQLTAELEAMATDITDYMNWVEATRLSTDESPFQDYFLLSKKIEFELLENQRDADPVASYIDNFEEILTRSD